MISEKERSEQIKEFFERILEIFDIQAVVDIEEQDQTIHVNLEGEDLSILIGSRGRTLNALQQIVNVVANKGRSEWLRVVVDAQGYRERRRRNLEEHANKVADQVVGEGEEMELEPMNSFERRIVHCALSEREDVITESRGEEPERFTVIVPETKLVDKE